MFLKKHLICHVVRNRLLLFGSFFFLDHFCYWMSPEIQLVHYLVWETRLHEVYSTPGASERHIICTCVGSGFNQFWSGKITTKTGKGSWELQNISGCTLGPGMDFQESYRSACLYIFLPLLLFPCPSSPFPLYPFLSSSLPFLCFPSVIPFSLSLCACACVWVCTSSYSVSDTDKSNRSLW